jgi:hypothetical protein
MQAPTRRLAALWRDLKKGLEYLTFYFIPCRSPFPMPVAIGGFWLGRVKCSSVC